MGVGEVLTDARPTVVADDVHVVYRVFGAGATKQPHDPSQALRRLLTRQKPPGVMEVHAIRGVSFTAYHGDAIGVIGRNGSGKSTLLRAIAGLLPVRQGQVYTNARPSLLGVNAALMKNLTGERNIYLGCLAMGMTKTEIDERFDDIVEFSGIGDFVNLPMNAYSSGMAARLRFAIAASISHDILLIDEALATGDTEFKLRSIARIHELREEAGTVFLVNHSSRTIRDTCNRAIWLDAGTIRMDGEANAVVDAYEEWAGTASKKGHKKKPKRDAP